MVSRGTCWELGLFAEPEGASREVDIFDGKEGEDRPTVVLQSKQLPMEDSVDVGQIVWCFIDRAGVVGSGGEVLLKY